MLEFEHRLKCLFFWGLHRLFEDILKACTDSDDIQFFPNGDWSRIEQANKKKTSSSSHISQPVEKQKTVEDFDITVNIEEPAGKQIDLNPSEIKIILIRLTKNSFQVKQSKPNDYPKESSSVAPSAVALPKRPEIVIDLTMDSDDDMANDNFEVYRNKSKSFNPSTLLRTQNSHPNGLSNLRFENNEFVYIID
jgi:hypothetical protein